MRRYLWIIVAAFLVSWMPGWLEDSDRHLGLQFDQAAIRANQLHLREIAGYLRAYHKSAGAYPSTSEGLECIKEAVRQQLRDEGSRYRPQIRVAPSGMLSLWGEPFIYENRVGLPEAAFADSGAANDAERVYSIEVDKGIYVWSIGAQQRYASYRKGKMQRNLMQSVYYASWIVAILCVWMFIRSVRIAEESGERILPETHALVAVVLFIVTAVYGGSRWSFASCYMWRISARWRTPELEQRYVKTMQQYRDRGIISKEAYDKLFAALKEDENSPDYWIKTE